MEKEANQGGDFYALVAWADKNRKQLMWTAGVVLAVVVVAGFYVMHKDSREAKANEAFFALKEPAPGRDTATAAMADQFAQLANDYPETSGGARAMMEAGGIYFEAGEFEKSRTIFQRLLAEHPDFPLANTAAVGIAASLEAEGKVAEATARYEDIVHRGTPDSTWPQARSALARLYTQQNHPDRAFEMYKEMLEGRSGDSWTMEAQVQVRELLEKYPQLRQQLAPPTAPSIPAAAAPPAATGPVLDVAKPRTQP
jgi:predicted negative regulator of RcsB-dependent stress response